MAVEPPTAVPIIGGIGMDRMTLRDFKRYCENKQFREIKFDRCNQDWRAGAIPVGFQFVFKQIMVSTAPDVGGVFLGEGGSLVYMERVKYIEVDPDLSVLGTTIRIVCGDTLGNRNNIHYILIAN